MYRATRCGPDTNINAGEQIAFYDAGLGSQPPHGALFVTRAWRWLHNIASQATGLGITQQSSTATRGSCGCMSPATASFCSDSAAAPTPSGCLAAMLSLRRAHTDAGRHAVRRDVGTSTDIAKEAVGRKVYQFVSSPKDAAYVEQRKALAAAFRQKQRSRCGR